MKSRTSSPEAKVREGKQLNKQVQLNAELKKLKKELERILNG